LSEQTGNGSAPPEEVHPLVVWCQALEGRLAEARAEQGRLGFENERLQSRVDELVAVITSLEEAYLLGKLRAAGKLPAHLVESLRAAAPPSSSGGTPTPAGRGSDTTVLYKEGG
jgi:hypothetical protein